jgi:hypothetical protein
MDNVTLSTHCITGLEGLDLGGLDNPSPELLQPLILVLQQQGRRTYWQSALGTCMCDLYSLTGFCGYRARLLS